MHAIVIGTLVIGGGSALAATGAEGKAPVTGSVKPTGAIKRWLVLGPFPNPELSDQKSTGPSDRAGFDIDYLAPIGGETKARITADTTVTKGPKGEVLEATTKRVELTTDTVLDFAPLYRDTNYKLAYAWAEVESARDQEAFFYLGSDDGAKVWVERRAGPPDELPRRPRSRGAWGPLHSQIAPRYEHRPRQGGERNSRVATQHRGV